MRELGSDAQALIALANDGDGPRATDRERVRRAVMAAVSGGAGLGGLTAAAGAKAASGAAAGSAAVASAATSGAGGLGLVAWFVVGGVLGVGAMVPATLTSDPSPPAQTATVAALQHGTAPTAHVAATPPTTAAEGATALPVATPPAAPATPAALAPRAPKAARPAADLAAESALLASAQESLSRGDAPAALAALQRHQRLHPDGALTPEREAARVLALCAAGRKIEARAAAAAFLSRHASSPLAARVGAACAD